MREITLMPYALRKGKFLKINHISVEWDEYYCAFKIIITFDTTRTRNDSKPMGVIILAHNAETAEKMISEYALLYTVVEEMVVQIPEMTDNKRYISIPGRNLSYERESRLDVDQ